MMAKIRIGITAKMFAAIFSTCKLVLITKHWGVRRSFEHGFIDYNKRGKEQRLILLADALGDEYHQ
ncbi:two-component system sensor histidine kinase BaeA, partial [Erwinia amylovora]|nr:two-component system sensor histidine kinase BaeA [Erwinia amylovora]